MGTIDASGAYRQSEDFGPDEKPRYVAYKPHKHAQLRVGRLTGGLYGGRDSGMRWYKTYAKYFTELGFIRGENDKSVFYHPETHVRIATHVDDSLVRGPKTAVAELFAKLKAKFIHHEEKYVHEDGGVYFLGMRITETVEDGVTWRHMDQQRDIEELLEQHGFDMARSVAGPNTTVPMPNKYLIDSDDTELTPVEQSEYRSIVGSLQYFVCGTQWHLAHPVARLGQFNAKATKGVRKQLDQLLAYLSGHADSKISGPVLKTTTWEVYSDSDHAGDRSTGTRSHTGVVTLCNGAPVQWRSNKQPVTSVSSAQAEIYAMAEAARDARLSAWKSEEMGCEKRRPIEIQVDNSAGIVFQAKMNPASKLKGMIDLRWNWVRELQDAGEIKAIKVCGTENVADLLTKCLGRSVFNKLLNIPREKAMELIKQSRTKD